MAYGDAMDVSTPLNSPPRTPRSRSLDLDATPRRYTATVISLDSSPVPNEYDTYEVEDRPNDYFYNDDQQTYNNTNTNSSPNHMPDLEEYDPDPQSPTHFHRTTIPPLKLSRPRTYASHRSEDMYAHQTLDHMVVSPPSSSPANPPIAILLTLTPNPASLAEATALDALGARFCKDFSNVEQKWCFVSLYTHFRQWAVENAHPLTKGGVGGEVDEGEVGIGPIHPYALRAKLEQEREVQWRLTVPVLRALIDREVAKGKTAFVVCGLAVGELEGVRAFGRQVAEPAGIVAFLPATQLTTPAVPMEYGNRSVPVDSAPLSQTYDALLAALYSKQLSHTADRRTETVDLPVSSSRDYDNGDAFQDEFTMDWY